MKVGAHDVGMQAVVPVSSGTHPAPTGVQHLPELAANSGLIYSSELHYGHYSWVLVLWYADRDAEGPTDLDTGVSMPLLQTSTSTAYLLQ